ncbi:amidase family protein [Pseudonocardia sp. NPDC049635]|uniref:amidase family protein n=1 Tax=Pseudonocardia sp. NPDC049635 TaxID=3155506 RepID=UPI0033F0AEF4
MADDVRAGRRSAAAVADALLDAVGAAPGLSQLTDGTAPPQLADTAPPQLTGTAAPLLMVDAEPLRAAAAAVDRRADRFALPLAGVTVAVEDGISVAGRGDEPVRRLRAAGALVAGRARTAAFAIGPDGSPGGRATAAAVAAGLVPLGIGIDGDGALRAAAAAHGLTALKPGRRVLPLPPGEERRWSGLAETTLVAADPLDVLAALDAITTGVHHGHDPDPGPPAGSLACSLRTGRARFAGPAATAGVQEAIRLLDAAGIGLVAADPPYRAVLPVHGARRRQAGLARRVEDLQLDPAQLPRAARSAVRRGRRVRRLGGLRPATPASWRQRMVGWLDDAGAEAGLLSAPAGPVAAGSTGFAAWNLAGLPSLVTPVLGGAGRRTCVQLVGRPGSERRLLATAALLYRR